MSIIDDALTVQAWNAGVAQPAASTTLVSVQSWCLPIAVLGMAGDDDVVWAIRVGPQLLVAGDPRDDGEAERLWAGIDAALDAWWTRCVRDGVWPQVIVPGPAAARLLAFATNRILRVSRDAAARRAALRVAWIVNRLPDPGQQALIVSTSAVREQFVTGMPDHDEEHLGALLAWIPGEIRDVTGTTVERAELAATQPAGVLASPDTDRALDKHVHRFATGPDQCRDRVAEHLGPVLDHQVQLLDRTLTLLTSLAEGRLAGGRLVLRGRDINTLLEAREVRLWRRHFADDPLAGQPRVVGGLRVQAQALQSAEALHTSLLWCRAAVDRYWAQSTSVDGPGVRGIVNSSGWASDGMVQITVAVPDSARIDGIDAWYLHGDLEGAWTCDAVSPGERQWMLALSARPGRMLPIPRVGDPAILLPVDPLGEIKRALAPRQTGKRTWMGTALHPRMVRT